MRRGVVFVRAMQTAEREGEQRNHCHRHRAQIEQLLHR
jgi:hypothetical protein